MNYISEKYCILSLVVEEYSSTVVEAKYSMMVQWWYSKYSSRSKVFYDELQWWYSKYSSGSTVFYDGYTLLKWWYSYRNTVFILYPLVEMQHPNIDL